MENGWQLVDYKILGGRIRMKAKILRLLNHTDGYISGQELCEKMGVSRTAIWKVMNQLKEEGYVIDSVSNKGYQLVKSPDLVTSYAIQSHLDTTCMGNQIYYYKELGSTNIKAKELANEVDCHGSLIITEQQNAGRGRRGRTWVSPSGSGIWMSLVLEPSFLPAHASMLTLVAAMAVAKAMNQVTNVKAQIKWPNDIIVNHKKVCGILTEMSCELDFIHYVVIGIGINANTEEFPEGIRKIATSLAMQVGQKVQRAELVAAVLKAFEDYYDLFVQTEDMSLLREEYNELLVHRNKTIKIMGQEEYQATALGIDKLGRLIVQCEDGEEKSILSGEVSVRGVNGYSN